MGFTPGELQPRQTKAGKAFLEETEVEPDALPGARFRNADTTDDVQTCLRGHALRLPQRRADHGRHRLLSLAD